MRSESLHGISFKDFDIRLEYTEEYVIAHFPRIDKFTKGVFQDMQIALEDWTKFFKTMGYQGTSAAVDVDNIKMIRLVSGLGFEHQGTADDMHVFMYRGEI